MWRLLVSLYRCGDPKYHANSVVSMQDSLSELNQQLLRHPSILPVDFDITPCGDLVLNVPHTVERYDAGFERDYQNHEFDDQRVPVAKLSHSSSGDTSSPQVNYWHRYDSVYWHFQIHGWKLIMEYFFCCMLVHRNCLCGTVSHDVFCDIVCGFWSISAVLKGISLISNTVWTSYIIWSVDVVNRIKKMWLQNCFMLKIFGVRVR